jgi:hypothetical protein
MRIEIARDKVVSSLATSSGDYCHPARMGLDAY